MNKNLPSMLIACIAIASSPCLAVCSVGSNTAWCFDRTQSGPAGGAEVANGGLGSSFATGDFDDDGKLDLAIGQPETFSSNGDGEVVVLFGDGNLPRATDMIRIGGGFFGSQGANAQVGAALAAWDFNSDGIDDLAIGAPGTDLARSEESCGQFDVDCVDAGRVFLSKGQTARSMTISRIDSINKNDCGRSPGDDALFGAALATGFKFPGKVGPTLYVGAPGEGVNLDEDAGYVSAIEGPFGAGTRRCAIYAPLLGGEFNRRSRMGAAIVAARFHPGFNALAPLAFGAPDADLGNIGNTGFPVVHFDVGNPDQAEGVYTQHGYWPPAITADLDHFGAALAAGDFDGDGDDDLVFGAPDKDSSGAAGAGRIYVLRNDGNTMTPTLIFDQGSLAGQTPEVGDQFSRALAAGYINGDRFADLIIGVTGEECCGDPGNEGFVAVMFGSASGLTASGFQQFRQSDIGGTSTASAQFGRILATADFNRDGLDEIIIGAPNHTVAGAANAGKVFIARLPGFVGGLNLGIQFSGLTNTAVDPLPLLANGADLVSVQLIAGPIDHVESPSVVVDYPSASISVGTATVAAWECGNPINQGGRTRMVCTFSGRLLQGQSAGTLQIRWQLFSNATPTTFARTATVSSAVNDTATANDSASLSAEVETNPQIFANGFETQ